MNKPDNGVANMPDPHAQLEKLHEVVVAGIDPLGMTSTQYPPVQDAAHIRPEIFARMSTGYALFGNVRIPTPAIYFADHPAGTVVTTPGEGSS